MKKILLFFLAALLLAGTAGTAEKADGRKLTVMVYMCGSNLESGYGSASADLREMEQAGISRDVTVLVMTGGSESWQTGYDPDLCSIVEIGAGRSRMVQKDSRRNMGVPETLTRLLRFGAEKYPAEEYALILWDHGGGPVEGVCWDELFSMDHLSLPELTGAIETAELGQKLKWIGFDACLMSSLEVAAALAPYAEYMIASQETEPAFGWNYSFLQGIEADPTGADTGRRIVDQYFAGHEDYADVMTLACLNLGKTTEIVEAMDAFFSGGMLQMTPEKFAGLSMLRQQATGFGKAVRGMGEDGYDLVDARGLIASMSGENGTGERLSALLEEMVVFSRSNEEGAKGLSLYHPYANKKKYLEKWRSDYADLHFSRGYTNYISVFGSLLTGTEITDWSGLVPADAGSGEGQENLFTLQLKEEQAASFASAQLLILKPSTGTERLEDGCSIVATGPASIDENGLVTGVYNGKLLYAEEEDGTLTGPVSYGLSEDGRYAYVLMTFFPEGEGNNWEYTHAAFYLDLSTGEEYPETAFVRIMDEATGIFTNRIAFSEDLYKYVHLWEWNRMMPDADGRGLRPRYTDWPQGEHRLTDFMGGYEIVLPNRWRFRLVGDQLNGDALQAVFEVTDVQQTAFCTEPVSVRNPNRTDLRGIPESAEAPGADFSLRASVMTAGLSRGVGLWLEVENRAEAETIYRFSPPVINQRRLSRFVMPEMTLRGAGGTGTAHCVIQWLDFYEIEELESIRLTATMIRDGTETEIPLSFRFENCSLRGLCPDEAPLARTERDGVTMELLGIGSSYDCHFEAYILVRNRRAWPFIPEEDLTVNGIQLRGLPVDDVPAGTETILAITVVNDLGVFGNHLKIETDLSPFAYAVIVSDHLLQRRGISAVSEIRMYGDYEQKGSYDEEFVLTLTEAAKLPEGYYGTYMNTNVRFRPSGEEETLQPASRVELAENNQYRVSLEKIFVGKTSMGLGLEITNRTDRPMNLFYRDPVLNGQPGEIPQSEYREWTVAPGATRIIVIVLGGEKLPETPEELLSAGFTLESAEQRAQGQEGAVCRMTFTEPLRTGVPGGLWAAPETAQPEKREMPDTDTASPAAEPEGVRVLAEEVTLPADPASGVRWIPADLTAEQKSRLESGFLVLLRPLDAEAMELISVHPMTLDAEGNPGALCSGLALCPADAPEINVMNLQVWQGTHQLAAASMYSLFAFNESRDKMQGISGVTVLADFDAGTAVLTDSQTEGAAFPHLCTVTHMDIPRYEFLVPEEQEGIRPWFYDWPIRWGTEWAVSQPKVRLGAEPLRLALRPLSAEEGIQAFFAVTEKDGTQYCLPLFPYPG